jgi:uncharacterized protein
MLYLLLGFLVGGLGTLVGVGGGFIIVPLLFFLHPEKSAAQITAISLFCVTLNATSGSIVYAIHKKINYKPGVIFALFSLPGAWLGVQLTNLVPRQKFELIYAFLLLTLGIYLWFKKSTENKGLATTHLKLSTRQYAIGATSSTGVGFVASFFGVGGGIIHVPLLNQVLKFPMHTATATSHFILAVTSFVAVLAHFHDGSLSISEPFVMYMAMGVVMGAQVGGRISKKMHPDFIMRGLAIALFGAAIRIIYFNLR